MSVAGRVAASLARERRGSQPPTLHSWATSNLPHRPRVPRAAARSKDWWGLLLILRAYGEWW